VIGEVGTILGRQGVNIANFALGRDAGGAVGVVNVDAPAGVVEGLMDQLRSIAAVKHVWLVQV
jgi:D-3-phosphoglycerate dehydrogenase